MSRSGTAPWRACTAKTCRPDRGPFWWIVLLDWTGRAEWPVVALSFPLRPLNPAPLSPQKPRLPPPLSKPRLSLPFKTPLPFKTRLPPSNTALKTPRRQATTYHQCDRYIEVDVDVASTPAVSYIVKMVQGATRSMLIDHAYLLESHFAHELPETLIGAIRCVGLPVCLPVC